jgi:hypoxanthine phosphoribosyltransferase
MTQLAETLVCGYEPCLRSDPILDPDGISFEIMRWKDFYQAADELAGKVLDSGQNFDAIIYPLRGGSFPADVVAAAIDRPAVEIGIRFYRGIGETNDRVEYYQPLLDDDDFAGLNILVVDDVNDTSRSYTWLADYLTNTRHAASVKLAVIHEKPKGERRPDHIPADFYVEETDTWVVYPWEMTGSEDHKPYEALCEIFARWIIRKDNLYIGLEACLERAKAIGFREDELPNPSDDDFLQRLALQLEKRRNELFPEDTAR